MESEKRELTEEELRHAAYYNWLVTELGNLYAPTVDQLDDLYTGLVSGIVCNLGRGKLPEILEGSGPKEPHSAKAFLSLWYSLLYCGNEKYPRDEWIVDHGVPAEWHDLIERGCAIEEEYLADPGKWLAEFRKKITEQQYRQNT